MQVVYHFSTEYKNSAMTELTAVRLAQLGELRSAEREGAVCLTNSQGLLKKMVGSCLAVDKDLASLQMLASLGGDVKPLALSPSSLFHCQVKSKET